METKPKQNPTKISFTPTKAVEREYKKSLLSIADRVTSLIATVTPEEAIKALDVYKDKIEPFAFIVAQNMVNKVNLKNKDAFLRNMEQIGNNMANFMYTDMGSQVQEIIAQNVTKIKTIVTYSRDEIAKVVEEARISGIRGEDLATKIEHIGEVSKTNAKRIAHTELAKANTAITRVRAESAGSEGYIWRTARDGNTRESHGTMEGKFVKWTEPPTLDNMTGHAGEFPYCRCYAEPVFKQNKGKTIGSYLPTFEEEKAKGIKNLFSTYERMVNSPVIQKENGKLLNASIPQGINKKLFTYSLSEENAPDKARVFKSVLGITKENAHVLEKQIELLLPHMEAKTKSTDMWGDRYEVIMPITGVNGKTVDVCTAWIYSKDMVANKISTKPRMTSAYIKTK